MFTVINTIIPGDILNDDIAIARHLMRVRMNLYILISLLLLWRDSQSTFLIWCCCTLQSQCLYLSIDYMVFLCVHRLVMRVKICFSHLSFGSHKEIVCAFFSIRKLIFQVFMYLYMYWLLISCEYKRYVYNY